MKITLDTMVRKHNACVAALDEGKICGTCRYEPVLQDVKPCNGCYNELLGMPVNPTNWEKPPSGLLADVDEREQYDCPIHGPQDGPDCVRC